MIRNPASLNSALFISLLVSLLLAGCATVPSAPVCPPNTQQLADCPPLSAVVDEEIEHIYAYRTWKPPKEVGKDPVAYGVNADIPIQGAGGKILGPDLFWDTTSKAPEKQGAPEIVRVANTAELDIDLDAMYAAIDDSIGMVHICNPNNPTGKVLDPNKLREFCIKASKKTLVLVDQAYNELIDEPHKHSMIPLVKAGHHVIVASTFSKLYGLAGIRVGYLIAS